MLVQERQSVELDTLRNSLKVQNTTIEINGLTVCNIYKNSVIKL